MRPLILITNDDGITAKGLCTLVDVAIEFGDVIVMAPETNTSGQSHSLTTTRPIRVRTVKCQQGLNLFACDGTPADCVKLSTEHFCPNKPDLVLSGINHGSNSSINILYSGTMGAVLEATTLGFNAIGFSLLNHNPEADFSDSVPFIRQIISQTLQYRLPKGVSLNVNIPRTDKVGPIRGIRVCHQAEAQWVDSFEKRIDPQGRPYWWLTGKFICDNAQQTSDEWALANGYISVVPIHTDFTEYGAVESMKKLFEQ